MKPTLCHPLPPAISRCVVSGDLVIARPALRFELSGPGAEDAAAVIRDGFALWGGHPRELRQLPADPLGSEEGVALLVGHAWELPEELVAAYPQDSQWPAETYHDADGVEHIGLDQIRF